MSNISPLRPLPGVPLSFGDILLIAILGFGGARLLSVLAATHMLAPAMGRATFIIVLLAFHSAALLGAVYLVAVWWRGLTPLHLGLQPSTAQWIRRALFAGLLIYPVANWVVLLTRNLLDIHEDNPQLELIAPDGASLGAMLGMLIMVGVVAPFAEEVVFRGLFYRWLRNRWGFAASAVISAVCFAAAHGIVPLMPALALLGILLAWLTERSGSIWPAIVTHGLFNAITVVLLYTTKAAGVDLP